MQIVEAGADGEDDIGVAHRLGGRILAPHAGHAEIEAVVGRQAPLAHEGGIDRDVELLGDRLQFLKRPGDANAAAGQDQRALGAGQEVEGAGDRLVGRRCAPVERSCIVARLGYGDRRRLDIEVVGHVEVHRARPAGAHQRKGIRQRLDQVFHLADAPRLLDDGVEYVGDVAVIAIIVLQRAAAELGGGHLSGDDEEGRAVVKGVGHRDHQVHRPRPGRGIDGQRLAGQAEIDIGHEAGGLLDARRDMADAVGVLVDAVEQADGAMPGIAQDERHFFLDQIFGDDVCAAYLVAGAALRVGRLRRGRGRAV